MEDGLDLSLADKFSWDGGRLLASEDVIKQVTRPALSPSTSKAMSGCVARWAADRILPRIPDPFSAAEIGTSAHAILEDLFNLPAEERSHERALNILLAHSKEAWPAQNEATFARRAQWIVEVTNAFQGLWAIPGEEDPSKIVVHGTETKLAEVEVAGVPVIGFIDRLDVVEGGVGVRDYKCLSLDTRIPTPDGWTTMGEVAVGDYVFGSDGVPTEVIGKSPIKHDRDCFRVTFSDGSSVICDDEHLWSIVDLTKGSREVLETTELRDRLADLTARGKPGSLVIPNASTLDLATRELAIDPYVLGTWLGDGTAKHGEITIGHQDRDDMLAILKAAWIGEIGTRVDKGSTSTMASLLRPNADACPFGHTEDFAPHSEADTKRRCRHCARDYHYPERKGERWNVSLRSLLSDAGLIQNKHVPIEYLRSSAEQRLALLQGLMDTDGSWNPRRKRAVFTTTERRLADALAELVLSFGLTAQRFEKPYTNATRPDATVFMVEFKPSGIQPFRLPRKALPVDDWNRSAKNRETIRCHRRAIRSIERVASVPTQCIKVAATDSLFLCGESMVLTHNTGKKPKDITRYGDDHGDQMRIYAEAIRVQTGQMPVQATLLYTKNTIASRRDVPLSKPAMSKTLRAFAKSWDTLNNHLANGYFPTKTGPLCGWCPLVNACPTAQAEGYVDRVGTAPAAVDLGIPEVRPFIPAALAGPPDPMEDFGSASMDDAVVDTYVEPDPFDAQQPVDQAAQPSAPPAVQLPAESTPRPDLGTVLSEVLSDDFAEPVIARSTPEQTPEEQSVPEVVADLLEHFIEDPLVPGTYLPIPGDIHITSTPEGDITVSEYLFQSEGKPWETTTHDGSLNASSYASIAMFATASMAYDEIQKANLKVDRDTIDALAQTLNFIVGTAQRELAGRVNPQDALHTRLRGALRSYMDAYPVPLQGGTAEDWETWVKRGVSHVSSIAKAALRLFATEPAGQPWKALTGRAVDAEDFVA